MNIFAVVYDELFPTEPTSLVSGDAGLPLITYCPNAMQ
jgi:hypothetical protein